MLAETYRLHEALSQAGIDRQPTHPRVKAPGSTSGPCLRVRLNQAGQVAAVETVTDAEWSGLWTIMEGFHNSFPIVRVKDSLLHPPAQNPVWVQLSEAEGDPRRVAGVLEETLSTTAATLAKKQLSLWKRLQEKKATELEDVATEATVEGRLLKALAVRFSEASGDPESLIRQIGAVGIRALREGALTTPDALQLLLVGKQPSPGQRKPPAFTVQLAFDLAGDEELPGRLYSRRVQEKLIDVLPIEAGGGRPSDQGGNHPAGACAFTDTGGLLQTAPFPKVMLPVLNKPFPLFAMFSEARCNFRYGLTDSNAVPVDKGVVRRLHEALSHIVAEEREGRTWQGVASGRFEARGGRKMDKMDLLIAYVEGEPDIPARVAGMFEGSDLAERKFEVDARAVCRALEGIVQKRPSSRLNLFILRKASEGQAFVVLSESPTVQEVVDGAERWLAGTSNLPAIRAPIPPDKKGGSSHWASPEALAPATVVRLASELWVVGGTRVNRLPGPGLGEVLTVLLRKPGYLETARHLLGLLIERHGRLLIGLTGALHGGSGHSLKDYGGKARRRALEAASVIGILLDALDRRKETYMRGTAFQVGQVLALADTLHREYCKNERGGSVPPQLIGNALMPVATDRLDRALARLSERITVYRGWADARGTGLSRWAVHEMGKLCSQLGDQDLTQSLDEPSKAELFLGYMALFPKKDDETEATIDQDEETADVDPTK